MYGLLYRCFYDGNRCVIDFCLNHALQTLFLVFDVFFYVSVAELEFQIALMPFVEINKLGDVLVINESRVFESIEDDRFVVENNVL